MSIERCSDVSWSIIEKQSSVSAITIVKAYLFFDITPTESMTQRNGTEQI